MRNLLLALLGLLVGACTSAPEPPAPAPSPSTAPPSNPEREVAGPPPNIIYIIGDDLGWPYHSFLGDDIVRMPNLDRLAREGTVFTNGYVTASVCNPSLRSLRTGVPAFGRRGGGTAGSVPAENSLPALLATRGYASLQTGKFWASDFLAAGFTEGTKVRTNGKKPPWMGDEEGIGRKTMQPVFDFIERHQNEPFFLWFAPKLPHRPWNAPRHFRRLYADRRAELSPDTLSYYANISWLDKVVGELLAFLDAKGLQSRTLIVYLSDNGYGPRPEDGLAVAPWKGAKGTTSDLGFRTPIVFHWPGRIPGGVVRDDLVYTLDLFPTILGYAGVEPPTNRPGLDLREALAGAPGPREEIIGFMDAVRIFDPDDLPPGNKSNAFFLRNARWHYVWAPSEETELLFDIADDPFEQKNLAAEQPEVARELRARIDAWRSPDTSMLGAPEGSMLPKTP